MEIREIKGDIFATNCNVICHQVNCQGAMGAGLAKYIKAHWPLVFEQYSNFLNNNTIVENGVKKNTRSFLGLCQIVKIDNYKYIANLFGQDRYGRDRQYTDYNALEISLYSLKRLVLFGGYGIKSIAIPYELGCGNGGGDWNIVFDIIKKVFSDTDLIIEIRRL